MSEQVRNNLLSISHVAKQLGKSRWTIRRWIQQGYITAVKIGDKTYIQRKEVERLLEQGTE